MFLIDKLIPFLIGGVIYVLLSSTIGAVFLRASIAFYNRMIQVPSRREVVPDPEFGKAAISIFAATALSLLAVLASRNFIAATSLSDNVKVIVSLIAAIPVSSTVLVVVLSRALPAKFIDTIFVAITFTLLTLIVFLIPPLAIVGAFYAGTFL